MATNHDRLSGDNPRGRYQHKMEISTVIPEPTSQNKESPKRCLTAMNCFKLLLLIFNILFIAVGIALAAVGIWTAVSKVYVSFVIGDTLFTAASYMLIAVGAIIIIVCIIGTVALFKENRRWLMIYFGLLIFGFIILIIAAVLGIVFKGEVEDVMVQSMRNSLINGYVKDKDITSAWDQLQTELKCCALSQKPLGPAVIFNFPYKDGTNPLTAKEKELQDGWPIYKRTEFYDKQRSIGVNERKYVPLSCCVVDEITKAYKSDKFCQYFSQGPPFNYDIEMKNDYIYYTGCYDKAKELVLSQSDIIVALAFVFAFIMIAGMVITFFLIRSFTDDEDAVKHRREPDNL